MKTLKGHRTQTLTLLNRYFKARTLETLYIHQRFYPRSERSNQGHLERRPCLFWHLKSDQMTKLNLQTNMLCNIMSKQNKTKLNRISEHVLPWFIGKDLRMATSHYYFTSVRWNQQHVFPHVLTMCSVRLRPCSLSWSLGQNFYSWIINPWK